MLTIFSLRNNMTHGHESFSLEEDLVHRVCRDNKEPELAVHRQSPQPEEGLTREGVVLGLAHHLPLLTSKLASALDEADSARFGDIVAVELEAATNGSEGLLIEHATSEP